MVGLGSSVWSFDVFLCLSLQGFEVLGFRGLGFRVWSLGV